jgi:hypothetical protein
LATSTRAAGWNRTVAASLARTGFAVGQRVSVQVGRKRIVIEPES